MQHLIAPPQYQLGAAELEVLLAMVRTGTLAAAGERLGVDASTVFRAIQRIERGLGQSLFDRSGHRAVLTEAGERLLPAALEVLNAMAALGGFIMVFGARIADGCTSGHGVSGIAQLAIGSFIAVTAMFAAGIVTANLIYKRV